MPVRLKIGNGVVFLRANLILHAVGRKCVWPKSPFLFQKKAESAFTDSAIPTLYTAHEVLWAWLIHC